MRVAEQRSKRGGSPRGVFEGEHRRNLSLDISTSPSSAAARVCEQRREPGAFAGRRTWGRLLLLTFFGEAKTTERSEVAAQANSRSELSAPTWRAAEGKKALCRRATPGIFAIVITLALSGCGSAAKKLETSKPTISKPGAYYLDDGPGDALPTNLDAITDAIPKTEPLHRGANRPYTVFGKTYVPNVSNEPFLQRGLASWYGRKFHGQMTSIGDIYDMYAMTAAHPTLPLPSYVRVTNPANMKSVVLRVNDRGPFHSDRIIDLSYLAAAKLDIARKGSGHVIVERVFAVDSKAAPPPLLVTSLPAPPVTTATITADASDLYLQLGAFSSMENAEIFRARLVRELEWNREPIQVVQKDNLFRVRMGPYKTREEAEAVATQVRQSHDFSPVIQKP